MAKKRISDDPAGFSALTEMLAAAGDCPEDLTPIAIETPRGLLVAALRATGRPVFAINPMAVARYRERQSVGETPKGKLLKKAVLQRVSPIPTLLRRLRAKATVPQSISACDNAATYRYSRVALPCAGPPSVNVVDPVPSHGSGTAGLLRKWLRFALSMIAVDSQRGQSGAAPVAAEKLTSDNTVGGE